MKKLKLDSLLPFGESYYYGDTMNCLEEFQSDLRDDLEETIFFSGGRQGVNKNGIFVYQRDKRPQVSVSKLLTSSRFNLN